MTSAFVLPYSAYGAGRVLTPLIKTWLQHKNQVTPFDFYSVIDSGADGCTFPAGFASHIGLDLKRGRKIQTQGSTGREEAYIHPVKIWVELDGARYHFTCDATFQPSLPIGLLGRAGFFNQFSLVSFDQRNHLVVLNK